ncbi:MAG TPA: hypothetical protein VD835_16925 [Pyrinomonadaceae bacterium]|nr:hypothetical protein [Pyrinomonadaceae bacterium]
MIRIRKQEETACGGEAASGVCAYELATRLTASDAYAPAGFDWRAVSASLCGTLGVDSGTVAPEVSSASGNRQVLV